MEVEKSGEDDEVLERSRQVESANAVSEADGPHREPHRVPREVFQTQNSTVLEQNLAQNVRCKAESDHLLSRNERKRPGCRNLSTPPC